MAARHRKDVTAERFFFNLTCMTQWLECGFTDRKVCGSNPTFAFGLPLSRLGQPDLVLPWGSMVARHRRTPQLNAFFITVIITTNSITSVFNTDSLLPYTNVKLITKIFDGLNIPPPKRQINLKVKKKRPSGATCYVVPPKRDQPCQGGLHLPLI
ncbi:hypothetical protein T265_03765 [Opisthorchis viverrini]|uniref:Uncharacterized protein n=1 Tax=Opisthorchis viverrini TaxID=6198 RepID=A0A074ZQK0_OPIVI|nr:hypothetical protein T265_03765 [Opisthorchis viverrini]KER29658.1 hypothetical protein T265_03765 [Opisthorchis viverrini]